ncbi:MAG: tetratricopeptide repeat protein [Deltaproteobacteria bacterium]|nr:tetratricopeptide repeat protein [Deltaproteobacteria bacterium]
MDENDRQERKSFLSQMEAYFGRNEVQAVLNLAQARLKRAPGDLDARIMICRVWLLQGRLDEARDMLNEMEEILASFSHVYACMGDICMKRGMREAAEDYYGKLKVLNPGAAPARDMPERLKGIEELHETDEEGETEENAGIPSGFQTVTLAELYIRQGHFLPAEEVLEKIIGGDPQNEKAAALLTEVREQLRRAVSAQPDAGVIAELSRWLDNIGRLRGHAA